MILIRSGLPTTFKGAFLPANEGVFLILSESFKIEWVLPVLLGLILT